MTVVLNIRNNTHCTAKIAQFYVLDILYSVNSVQVDWFHNSVTNCIYLLLVCFEVSEWAERITINSLQAVSTCMKAYWTCAWCQSLYGGLKSTIGSCAFMNTTDERLKVSYTEGLYMQGLFKISVYLLISTKQRREGWKGKCGNFLY